MKLRHVGHAVRFVATIVTGGAILAAFGLWLLSRGPVSLDAVAPYVASMLSRGNGLTVAIDHTALDLAPGGHFEILAQGVHFSRQGGGATLTLADLSLEFSLRTLLRGAIAPTRIIVSRPELRLVRDRDGSFRLGVGDLGGGAAEDWGAQLVGDLMRPPAGRGTLGFLIHLDVRDASLAVDDRSLGVVWHAQDADLTLDRSANRTVGEFQIAFGQGASAGALNGDFSYFPTLYRWAVVRVGFSGLKPSSWAGAAPALADLAALDLPVSGNVKAEIDPKQANLRDAIVDLSFGAGQLKSAAFSGGALAVTGAKLQGGYDPVKGRINLGLLSVDFGPGTASVSGTIDGVGADLLSGAKPPAFDLTLSLDANAIKADDLARLWPPDAAKDARNWVTQHLHDGTLDTLQATLGLHVDLAPGAAAPATVSKLAGTMKYSNLSVEYFRPLPPVTGVNGSATFDPTSITFTANSGTSGGLHVTAGTARLYKLDTNDQQAQIQVDLQGPIPDALTLLDHPPLGYAKEIGLDPKKAQGNVVARLDFGLPLVHDLTLAQVDYSAQAKLTGVALNQIMFGRDLSNGDLTLKLTRKAAQVDGTAQLAGVPIALLWRENIGPGAPPAAHYEVKAQLDDAQRAALGLDFLGKVVSGTVGVAADYDVAANKTGSATATLDLTNAALDVKQIDWKKAAGVAATAKLALTVANGKVTEISDANVSGGGMDAKWSMSFDKDGISGVTIEHVVGGANDFHGRINRDAQGGWHVNLAGRSLDAAGLIDEFERTAQGTTPTPPLDIVLRLDRLSLGPDRQARAVSAALTSDSAHWQRATITAKLSDKTSVSLVYGGAAGPRQFNLTTDDFGALLKDLGIYGDVVGGKFSLKGEAKDINGKRTLVTQAVGSDYSVVRAPTLAQLLSIASFSGIGGLLSGQGIPFSRIEGEVDFTSGEITLENMRAYGGAIGINASGLVDRDAGQMNISGTLVPAYTLNTVISNIPIIGNLLTGGAGQGIFAANFRLYGAIDNPQISVNPLSTLAPGVLRNLFLFSPGGPERTPPEAQPSAPPELPPPSPSGK